MPGGAEAACPPCTLPTSPTESNRQEFPSSRHDEMPQLLSSELRLAAAASMTTVEPPGHEQHCSSLAVTAEAVEGTRLPPHACWQRESCRRRSVRVA